MCKRLSGKGTNFKRLSFDNVWFSKAKFMGKLKDLLQGAELEWRKLGEVVKIISAPSKIKTKGYKKCGKIPIISQSEEFISGYTDEDYKPVNTGEYIIFGDHSQHIKYVDFSFVQGADGLKILQTDIAVPKYVYYAFTNNYRKRKGYKRHWATAKDTPIPLPSLPEQLRLVEILDKFDTLANSLESGLPREIELRRRQYEYYREQLLSFN